MTQTPPDPSTAGSQELHPPQGPAEIPAIDSAELFRNHREICIRHGGEIYRLRLTKSGKLILHK